MRRLLTAVVVLALLVVMGWGGWRVVSTVQDAPSEDDALIRVTAQVQTRTLEETVVTRGVIGFGAAEPVVAGGSGRITALGLSPGSMVVAGYVVLEVDGRPVVAVEGSRPFWRDLALGASGPDVAELQRLLADAGYLSVDPDARFGVASRSALQAWQEEHGFPEPDGVFLVNDVLVGSWPQRVGQVAVRIGEFIQPGSVLFEVTGDTPLVTVELIPSDRLRVTAGDPARVELTATGDIAHGTITDMAVTPIIDDAGSVHYPGTVALDEVLEAPEGTQVRVVIVVNRAEGVVAIPLGSLVADGDGGSAVRVVRPDGSTETVSVELGISEGAWVEVVSGLTGDETVLVAEG